MGFSFLTEIQEGTVNIMETILFLLSYAGGFFLMYNHNAGVISKSLDFVIIFLVAVAMVS